MVMADPVGGKWFDCFWGVMTVYDLQVIKENEHWRVTSNWMSCHICQVDFYFLPGQTECHFHEMGITYYNPFCLLLLGFMYTSTVLAYLPAVNEWLQQNGGGKLEEVKAPEAQPLT
jgi:hypothetical protein